MGTIADNAWEWHSTILDGRNQPQAGTLPGCGV
jgi:hypothetical protein